MIIRTLFQTTPISSTCQREPPVTPSNHQSSISQLTCSLTCLISAHRQRASDTEMATCSPNDLTIRCRRVTSDKFEVPANDRHLNSECDAVNDHPWPSFGSVLLFFRSVVSPNSLFEVSDIEPYLPKQDQHTYKRQLAGLDV